MLKAIAKYQNPSFRLIKNTFENSSTFSFHYVDESGIIKEIMNLNNSEALQDSDIIVKIIRDNLDLFKQILYQHGGSREKEKQL